MHNAYIFFVYKMKYIFKAAGIQNGGIKNTKWRTLDIHRFRTDTGHMLSLSVPLPVALVVERCVTVATGVGLDPGVGEDVSVRIWARARDLAAYSTDVLSHPVQLNSLQHLQEDT